MVIARNPKIAAALIVVTFVCLGLLVRRAGPTFSVRGELPESDLKQVLEIAKDQFRTEVFGNVSWRSIGQIPEGVRRYLDYGTVVIDVRSEDVVEVLIATNEGRIAGRSYMINRTVTGWQTGRIEGWGE